MHGSVRLFGFRRFFLLAAAAAAALAGPGCSRNFFRQRADNDVTGLLTQKNVFPDWQIRNWHAYPDPRARYADPSRPDRPPYPPDDYAARVLSPNPQHPGRKSGAGRIDGDGYMHYLAAWDAENRVLNPNLPPVVPPPPGPMGPPPPAVNENGPPAEKLPPPKLVPPTVPAPAPVPPGKGTAAAPPATTPVAVDWKPAGSAPATAAAAGGSAAVRPDPAVQQAGGIGPRVTESRETGVIVAAGEIPDGNKTIPMVVMIPTGQPAPAPAPPNPPKKDDPAPLPPGVGPSPAGPITPGEGPAALVATGDLATGFLTALATNEKAFRIRIEQAVQLGMFNSRELQDRREDLYLAALPVTLERFNLAALGFFTEQAALDFAGKSLGRSPRNSSAFNTGMGFSKLFPTGALLMVKLANQVVIDLSGGKPTTTLSNFSLSLSQPFLQGGGYAVTLEPLTLAERNLLYAIRSYARFRKLYYVSVSAGGNITNNPYGLQGLAVNLGRGIGGNLTAPVVGYLPILANASVIANQRRNVAFLEQLLQLYQAFREGGQQSDLQVMQVEQQLINGRTTLFGQANVAAAGGGGVNSGTGIRGYLDALDNFKLQLGLPLTTHLELDPAPVRPIQEQLARFDTMYAQVHEVEALARRYDPAEPVARFRGRWRTLLTDSPLVRGTPFAANISNRWAAWERLTPDELTKRLAGLAEQRRQILDRKADRQVKGLPEPEDEARRLTALESDIDLGVFERAVRFYEAQPWAKDKGALRDTAQAAAFRDVFNAFYQLILEGRNDRLEEIRRQWPKLPPLMVDGVDVLDVPLDDATTAAVRAALTHRLDLMNSRAQVVDAWRQIKVQANSLLGVFNVQYNLNSSTPPNGANPFALSGSRTDHNVTFTGELPLVRRVQRNNYRAALIGYQRQRRTLQAFEDNIANDVRSDTRELRAMAQLYRAQQRLVELGYAQVDNARAVLLQPPAPGAQTDPGTAAALTLQVLNAQTSLVSAQNQLYTIWVNFMVSRMVYYVDLELMQIDERGVWCNESLPGNPDPDGPPPEPAPGGERLPAPRAVPGRGN